MNTANKITLIRIALIPILIVLMQFQNAFCNVAAAIVFLIAALTDYVDGYIARKYNQVTNFGKFIDPIADKLLVIGAMVMLVEQGKLAAWIVVIMIAREFIISGFRLLACAEGNVIAAGSLGKIKTVLQMIAIVALMVGTLLLGGIGAILAEIFVWASLIMTIASCIDYIWKGRALINTRF